MDHYKTFNTSLKFFMRELINLRPDLKELKLMFSLYKVMKTFSKKSPQKYFHSLVNPHSKELLARDFEYFLSDDFNDPEVDKILPVIKEEFILLNDDNKDMVWKHLVVLYKLSLDCELKII
jgi:hypothetical protein